MVPDDVVIIVGDTTGGQTEGLMDCAFDIEATAEVDFYFFDGVLTLVDDIMALIDAAEVTAPNELPFYKIVVVSRDFDWSVVVALVFGEDAVCSSSRES